MFVLLEDMRCIREVLISQHAFPRVTDTPYMTVQNRQSDIHFLDDQARYVAETFSTIIIIQYEILKAIATFNRAPARSGQFEQNDQFRPQKLRNLWVEHVLCIDVSATGASYGAIISRGLQEDVLHDIERRLVQSQIFERWQYFESAAYFVTSF